MNFDLQKILAQLQARKLRRTLGIYLGVALPVIGVANLLENRYALEGVWFDRLLLLLLFGLLLTALLGWYHGHQKKLHRGQYEIPLIALLVVSAAAAIAVVPRGGPSPRPARQATDKSIAVLPFQNFSERKEDEFFSDGITEDILTQLSKVADLRVISRTTMMRYRGTSKSVREIGAELNVGAILEGSVRRDGERVRIVGQLIDARTDEHLWADTFDHDLKDVFAIQSRVAREISRALRAILSPREEERIATPPTSSVEAYALYLQGRERYGRYSPEENEKSIAFFRSAISLDPDFAQAYAGLSDAYSQRVQRFGYPVHWLDSALTAGMRAVELDNESAEAHKSVALAYDNLGRTEMAAEAYERAVEINPNYHTALRNLGLLHYRAGRLDRAYTIAVKSVSLAPDEMIGYVQVGMALRLLGLDSASAEWYARGRRITPDSPFPLLGLAELHLTQGNLGAARLLADTLLTMAPSLPPAIDFLLSLQITEGKGQEGLATFRRAGSGSDEKGAYLLMQNGRREEGRAMALEVIARARRFLERGDESVTPLERGAAAFAVIGEIDSAVAWMERAFRAGWRDYRLAALDPLLSPLRSDPSFRKVQTEAEDLVREMRSTVLLESNR